MPDLDQLRELSRRMDRPDFDQIVEARRRLVRRRWTVAAAATAAAVVVVAGTLARPGPPSRSDLPPVDRSPTPTATPAPEPVVPAGQQTITSEVGLAEVHGWDVLATQTNAQPGNRGATLLSAVVPDTRQFASTYCRGPADLMFIIDIGDGSQGYDRCSPDAATTLAPDAGIGDLVYQDPVQAPQTIRMWIVRPSPSWLRCMDVGGGDCAISDLAPLVAPDVDFGFEVYAHEPTLAFRLLDDSGSGAPYPVQALASTTGRDAWLADRAVVAAPDAARLVVRLPASDRERLLDVYEGSGSHSERCRRQGRDALPDPATTDSQVYVRALDRLCGTDLRLVVDGTVVPRAEVPTDDGHFQELGALLPAGPEHEVVVEVVRGDPRDVTYAVVLRNRTRMP